MTPSSGCALPRRPSSLWIRALRQALRPVTSLAVSWQICQGNVTTTVFGDPSRTHSAEERGLETSSNRLGRRGNALQSNGSQIMGRLRFELRTNRLKAGLDSLKTHYTTSPTSCFPRYFPRHNPHIIVSSRIALCHSQDFQLDKLVTQSGRMTNNQAAPLDPQKRGSTPADDPGESGGRKRQIKDSSKPQVYLGVRPTPTHPQPQGP